MATAHRHSRLRSTSVLTFPPCHCIIKSDGSENYTVRISIPIPPSLPKNIKHDKPFNFFQVPGKPHLSPSFVRPPCLTDAVSHLVSFCTETNTILTLLLSSLSASLNLSPENTFSTVFTVPTWLPPTSSALYTTSLSPLPRPASPRPRIQSSGP